MNESLSLEERIRRAERADMISAAKMAIAAFAAAAGTAMIIYGSEPNDKTNGCPDVEKRFNTPENNKSDKVLVNKSEDKKAASYLRTDDFIGLKDGHGYPFLHSP